MASGPGGLSPLPGTLLDVEAGEGWWKEGLSWPYVSVGSSRPPGPACPEDTWELTWEADPMRRTERHLAYGSRGGTGPCVRAAVGETLVITT